LTIKLKPARLTFTLLVVVSRIPARAAANELSQNEKQDGWILLFDGKSTKDWMTSSTWESCPEALDQESIAPWKCPNLDARGWDLVYERPWTDFVLQLDYLISAKTNSVVMLRISPLKALPGFDVEYNGIEVQIQDSGETGLHDTGALYDLVRPTSNAQKPVGQWNHLEIGCDRNFIDVTLNGVHVNHMDLDQWMRPYERPDGTKHKFNVAWKYHSRTGYIGLQKHGGEFWLGMPGTPLRFAALALMTLRSFHCGSNSFLDPVVGESA
jgi:hypothetical protein